VAVNHSEDFTPDDQPKAIDRLLDAQAARGARNDATLYAVHFDGPDLNSLGAAKLDWMLKDDSALPLAIWIAVPADEQSAARQASVTTYLKDHGLKPEQIQFNAGPNPHTDYPAASADRDASNSDFSNSGGATLGGGSSSSSSSSGGSH
jgi:hypothetical protein